MTMDEKSRAPYAGAFLFLAAFGLYVATLAPTVTFWDSGELTAASYILGVPHQPGYPLFCLMGRAASMLPFGSIAYRTNLMSAGFSAGTVLLVYLAILGLFRYRSESNDEPGTGGVMFAAGVAAVLGVTRVFWSQAVVAEVYAAGGFIVALSIYIFILAISGTLSCERYVALSGFLFGLGVVNHMSHLLYLPALLVTWLYAGRYRRADAAVILSTGALFALLGLSVLIYLPIRAASLPALNIGHPDTWPNLVWALKLDIISRHTNWLIGSVGKVAGGTASLGPAKLVAALAAVSAVAALVREDRRVYLPLGLYFVVYTVVVAAQVSGSERDIMFGLPDKFFIPSAICAAVLAAGFLRPALVSHSTARFAPALAVLVFGAAILLMYRNMTPNDRSQNYIAADYAANSLKSADERGVLMTWGDNGVFPLWYMQAVERYRDDVVLVHTPLLTYGWFFGDVERKLGMDVGFVEGYFLGENVYRMLKAVTPARRFAYDYSAVRFLKLDESKLTVRGLAYYEGAVPSGDPWAYYVFRGLAEPSVHKDRMDANIVEIYRYMAGQSAAGIPVRQAAAIGLRQP